MTRYRAPRWSWTLNAGPPWTRKARRSRGALPALGYPNVSDVRVGKSIDLKVDAPDEAAPRPALTRCAERFLANPVIEDSRWCPWSGTEWPSRRPAEVSGPRVGVVTFPGSLDDRDALRAAASMGGDAGAAVARGRRPRRAQAASCPGGSPTATTCAPGPSPGSRRSWRRPGLRRGRRAGPRHLQRLPDPVRGRAAARGADPEPAAVVRLPLGARARRGRAR